MTITIADLFKTETRDEIFNSIMANLASLQLKTTSWVAGGMARTLVFGIAQKFSDMTQQLVLINKGGFREESSGNWLTYLSRNTYGNERFGAQAGTTNVTFVSTSAVSYGPFAVGDVHLEHATTKKTYTSTASLTVGAGATVTIAVVADEQGTASNANAGTITKIVSPSMPGVTVSNATALIGVDEETDAAIKQRDDDKLGALSPFGPKGAYEYFAKGVKRADGSIIDVNRVKTISTSGAVTVTVASSSGAVAGSVGTPGTDLYLVDQSIKANAVPDGITETTQSATTQSIAITYTAYVSTKANKTDAEVKALIAAQFVSFFSNATGGAPIGGVVLTPPNGYVFHTALKDQIFQAVKDSAGVTFVREATISTPAADVLIGATSVPTLGTITPTVVFLAE